LLECPLGVVFSVSEILRLASAPGPRRCCAYRASLGVGTGLCSVRGGGEMDAVAAIIASIVVLYIIVRRRT
jgi:hypothetical protein